MGPTKPERRSQYRQAYGPDWWRDDEIKAQYNKGEPPTGELDVVGDFISLIRERLGGGEWFFEDLLQQIEATPKTQDTLEIVAYLSERIPAEGVADDAKIWRDFAQFFEAELEEEFEEDTDEAEALQPQVEVPELIHAQEAAHEELPSAQEPFHEEESVATIPGPRLELYSRVKHALEEMLEKPQSGERYRLGLDFGTSRSKMQVRDRDTEEIVDAFFQKSPAEPSALSINKETGVVLFGDEAAVGQAYEADRFLVRSLKRMLLDGEASGVEKNFQKLTTPLLTVMAMTWLHADATKRLQGVVPKGEHVDLVLPPNLTFPVSIGTGSKKSMEPFWKPGYGQRNVFFRDLLEFSAISGVCFSRATNGVLPDKLSEWHDLLDLFRKEPIQELLVKAKHAHLTQSTSEPLAALAEHSAAEMGNGLHMVVDSGAGTTDWAIVLVDGDRRWVVEKGMMRVGGDSVDLSMYECLLDTLKADLPAGFTADEHSLKAGIMARLGGEKIRLLEDGYLDFIVMEDPLLRHIGNPSVPLDLDLVLDSCRTEFQNLADKIGKTLTKVPNQLSKSSKFLDKRGVSRKYSLRDLKSVFLVGGNSSLSVFKEELQKAVSESLDYWQVKGQVPLQPLAIPATERAAGRINEATYLLNAVAIGASRIELPDPTALCQDQAPREWLDPLDKDAG